MEITEEALFERYNLLSTEELIDLRAKGTLTNMAFNVLDNVLESRGIKESQRNDLTNQEKQQKSQVSVTERHITVARIHFVLGCLFTIHSVGVFIYIAITFNQIKTFAWGVFFLCYFVLAMMLSCLFFIVSDGTMKRKEWARTASIAIAVLLLFGFPVGTILGVFLLINTNSSWKVR